MAPLAPGTTSLTTSIPVADLQREGQLVEGGGVHMALTFELASREVGRAFFSEAAVDAYEEGAFLPVRFLDDVPTPVMFTADRVPGPAQNHDLRLSEI